MKDYSTFTNEELVDMIRAGEEDAYGQLFYNLRPVILHEAAMYRNRIDYYSTDDYLQEGLILIWKTIQKNNYKASSGRFSTYIGVAYRRELIRIFTKYVRKNPVCTGEFEDCHGRVIRTYAESLHAQKIREQNRERQRRYQERKRAEKEQASTDQKAGDQSGTQPMTKKERNRKAREY